MSGTATLLTFAGGLSKTPQAYVAKYLRQISASRSRFIRIIGFDFDVADLDAEAERYTIGNRRHIEGGGVDDPAVFSGIVRAASRAIDLTHGARGERRNGLAGIAYDHRTTRTTVTLLAEALAELGALAPRIEVVVIGGTGGAVGASWLPLAPEIIAEAARTSGCEAEVALHLLAISAELLPVSQRTPYLAENSLAVLRETVAVATGQAARLLNEQGRPLDVEAIHLVSITPPNATTHELDATEALRRIQLSTLYHAGVVALELGGGVAGQRLKSHFTNFVGAPEAVLRIVHPAGFRLPRPEIVAASVGRVGLAVVGQVDRVDETGAPAPVLATRDAVEFALATGVPDVAQAFISELHQFSLDTDRSNPASVLRDASYQHAATLSGVNADSIGIVPIGEAIPLSYFDPARSSAQLVQRVAEDLDAWQSTNRSVLGDALNATRPTLNEALSTHFTNVTLEILNGKAKFASERSRAGLAQLAYGALSMHTERLRTGWIATLEHLGRISDGAGGWLDHRAFLDAEIGRIFSDAATSRIGAIAPFCTVAALRHARELAAARANLELLGRSVGSLVQVLDALQDVFEREQRHLRAARSICSGIRMVAKTQLGDGENDLTSEREYGPFAIVGEAQLRSVVAPVIEIETARAISSLTWKVDDDALVGWIEAERIAGHAAPSIHARNLAILTSKSTTALQQAAATIEITGVVAEAFGTAGQMLGALRASGDPLREVAVEVLTASEQPTTASVLVIPAAIAPGAAELFQNLRIELARNETIVMSEEDDTIRYVSGVAGVPLYALHSAIRASRPYVTSNRVLHLDDGLEAARRVSREIFRHEGIAWIPSVRLARVLGDSATLRRTAIAVGAGLLIATEVPTPAGQRTVWSARGVRATGAEPDVTTTGLALVRVINEGVLRSAVETAIAKFDRLPVAKRLAGLHGALDALKRRAPAALGDDRDLGRVVRIGLQIEIGRLTLLAGGATA